MSLRFAATFLCLMIAATAVAQSFRFSAGVSETQIGVQDQVQVDYVIENGENLSFRGPQGGGFKNFRVLVGPQSSQSTQLNIVNGRREMRSTTTFSYVLQPTATGELVIPAGIVTGPDGKAYASNAMRISVQKGSLARQAPSRDPFDMMNDDPFFDEALRAMRRQQQQMMSQPRSAPPSKPAQPATQANLGNSVFLKAQADKTHVSVGEQVTISYKLYTQLPMQLQISKLPSLNGFWTQDFEMEQEPKPIEETVNGKKYQVFTFKKSALYPQQPGALTLDPAEAEGVVRMVQRIPGRNPFEEMFADDPAFQQLFGGSLQMSGSFGNGFFDNVSYQDVPVKIKSQPLSIRVDPLPTPPAADSFGGAVGNFTLSARLDRNRMTTDDGASLVVTITGSGNLALFEAPRLRLPEGLDQFDPQVTDTITGRIGVIRGSKIITYPLSAGMAGHYTIPPVAFTYYSPEDRQYHTLRSQPLELDVAPGKNKPGVPMRTTQPLAPLLTQAGYQTSPHIALYRRPGYWALFALPAVAVAGIELGRRRKARRDDDLVNRRDRFANRIAIRRLKQAHLLLHAGNPVAFYEELAKAIWLYYSDKFSIPLSELSRERLEQLKDDGKISPEQMQETNRLIDASELALYASHSTSGDRQTLYEQAARLISKLERRG